MAYAIVARQPGGISVLHRTDITPAEPGHGEVLVPLLAAVAISSLGYVSVFVLLGYVTGRAVLYGLAYVFIWESGITSEGSELILRG
jgi:hypothetical protein